MTLHRFAARRDANEPEIRARFAHHGWHTEALSGAGMPDLLCFPRKPNMAGTNNRCHTLSVLVDVKTPKGGYKPAQVKKWTALHAKGIPVYIARTLGDVDDIVAGKARAWAPPAGTGATLGYVIEARSRCNKNGCKRLRPCASHDNYTPPRSKPVDAAKEAEATFAPDNVPILHIRRADGFCTCGAGPEERC